MVHLILLEEGKHKTERRRVTFSPSLDLFSGKEQIGSKKNIIKKKSLDPGEIACYSHVKDEIFDLLEKIKN